MVKNVVVKNVTISVEENYVRVALTTDKEFDRYLANEDGTYTLGKSNVIFTSAIALGAILKDDDSAAFAVNTLNLNPNGYSVILSHATIDVLVEPVKSGTDYKNPWSERAEARHFDHDTFINHVVNIKLTDRAKMMLDRMALQMLGM